MTLAQAPRFRPPAPVPREKPLGRLAFMAAVMSNPVTAWTQAHFTKPIVSGVSVIGFGAVVSDPAGVRHILVDNAANYRKDKLQLRLLSPGLGNGLLTAEGEQWKAQRRALAPLFTPRRVGDFAAPMAEAADRVVERWGRLREGRTADIALDMARVTLDILERTIFTDGLARAPDAFGAAMTDYFNTFGRIDPLDLLQAPDWIPRIARLRGRAPLKFFDGAVNEIIAARRAALAKGGTPPRDLLTFLLEAADPETGRGLSEAEIKANIITFVGAGHETTANALTWSLYLLATAPDVRARLEAEADAVLPEGSCAPGAVEKLVATRAVIDEALRLYPPAAIISRAAVADDEILGVKIPAGGTVFVAPYVLHRHRLLWDEPDYFNPWRFLPEARGKIDRFAYLPFGAGPRVCIGASFALQEAVIVLATLLRRYRLDLSPGHKVEPRQRITLRPSDGMKMVISRR